MKRQNFTMTKEDLREYLKDYMNQIEHESLNLVKVFHKISDLCNDLDFSEEDIIKAFEEFENGHKVVLHIPVIISIPEYILPYHNILANKSLSQKTRTTQLRNFHIKLCRDLAEVLEISLKEKRIAWLEEVKTQLEKEGISCHTTKKADG